MTSEKKFDEKNFWFKIIEYWFYGYSVYRNDSNVDLGKSMKKTYRKGAALRNILQLQHYSSKPIS